MNMEPDSKNVKRPPKGTKTWEYLAILSCWVMSLSFGTISGWNSPSAVKLMAPDSPIEVEPSELSTLVTMVMIGYALGPPINAFIVDRIGRKNTILLGAVPLIISWAVIAIATKVWELHLARFIGGLFLGINLCVYPIYIGEISSPTTRGISSALIVFGFYAGTLLAFACIPYLPISTMSLIFLGIGVAFGVLFFFMPESPYYLAMKNRLEDATQTLMKLRGRTKVADDMAIIMAALPGKGTNDDNSGKPSWRENFKNIFTVRGNRRAFFIALLLTAIRFCGGFYTIFTYGQLILQETSEAISDYMANVSVGICLLISSFVNSLVVDKVGRRPLMMISGLIGGLCCFAISGFFFVKEYLQLDVSEFALVPFIGSMIMVFVLSCGVANLQLIMLSELFATEIKAVSTTLIGVIGGIFGALNSKLYILLAISWGYGHCVPFLASGLLLWICTSILLCCTPETKGKTLAEIQEELNGKR